MKLNETLEKALEEMDILEEYYKERYKTTTEFINKEQDKYKFGLAIFKSLCAKLKDEPNPSCLSENEKKFIKDEVEFCDTDEKDNLNYKLKNPEKYSHNYDLNPLTSVKRVQSLIQHVNLLNDSVIIMLLIRFESFISEIHRNLLIEFPDTYLKDKSIKYSDLISLNSDVNEIMKSFIDSEVDEFMRKPIKDWYKSFEEKHKCKFVFDDEFDHFKEIYYRRNIIVHNQGKANKSYLNGIKNSPTCTSGENLSPSYDYLLDAIDCTRLVIIQTILGLLKICSDKSDRSDVIDSIFLSGYDFMIKNKWKMSKYIFHALMTTQGQSEANSWRNKVNYYISCKNLDGLDSIRDEVNSIDTSLMALDLAVAKPALLDDHAKVTEILDKIVGKEISLHHMKTWPLFNQYRQSDEYQILIDRHRELFELETYSASDINCLYQ